MGYDWSSKNLGVSNCCSFPGKAVGVSIGGSAVAPAQAEVMLQFFFSNLNLCVLLVSNDII